MSNSVEVEVGGEKMLWGWNVNCILTIEATIEARTGNKVSFDDWVTKTDAWTTADHLLLLWVGIHRFNKQISIEEIGERLNMGEMKLFLVRFWKVMRDQIPDELKKKITEESELLKLEMTSRSSPGNSG